MKESSKGVILSALVYPGLGQLLLGSIFSGILFALFTTGALLVVIYRVTIRIYQAIDQISPLLDKESIEVKRIMDLISSSSSESWRIEAISFIFALSCWLISILHAYFLGRRLDRQKC